MNREELRGRRPLPSLPREERAFPGPSIETGFFGAFDGFDHFSRVGSCQGDPTRPEQSREIFQHLLIRPNSTRGFERYFLTRSAGRVMTREMPWDFFLAVTSGRIYRLTALLLLDGRLSRTPQHFKLQ